MIWSLHSPTEMPKVRKIKRMASYIKFLTSLCVCMVMCMQAQACVKVDMFPHVHTETRDQPWGSWLRAVHLAF